MTEEEVATRVARMREEGIASGWIFVHLKAEGVPEQVAHRFISPPISEGLARYLAAVLVRAD